VSVLLSSANFAVSKYPAGMGPQQLVIADLDGDGHPDLATADRLSGPPSTVSVLINNGMGKFGAATPFQVGNGPYSVAAGDFDHDKIVDLVSANYDASTVSVLRGKGKGVFAAPVDLTIGTHPESVVVADLNNDGKPDIATANSSSNDVTVIINTSP
jgi:hypothetical protein